MSASSITVRHLGNTANNAFHNAILLSDLAGIESALPISMFGLGHGMSAPAWEVVDFEVPDPSWVANPEWQTFAEAAQINARYSDIVIQAENDSRTAPLPSAYRNPTFLPGLRRTANAWLGGKSWAQPLVELRTRQGLARRMPVEETDDQINIIYGADSLASQRVPENPRRTVAFEHGTIRWVGDGDGQLHDAYREQIQRVSHLWVTNLDPRTVEIAEDLAPGRWSALPHPFVPDSRVPLAESPDKRQALLERTRSEYLVLLPSSQNWSKFHDKGSIKALTAFRDLRRAGVPVGMVAVEWGLQLAESKAFLEAEGVGDNVVWVPPMARFGLQHMMANVDVVWDQFGLEAFGALALRATEQGTPLISKGLAPIGEKLIGGPVPWLHASSSEDIVHETTQVLEEMARVGRTVVIEKTRARYRSWLLDKHSPAITAALQRDLYSAIVDGSFEQGAAVPEQWAVLLDQKSHGRGGTL